MTFTAKGFKFWGI